MVSGEVRFRAGRPAVGLRYTIGHGHRDVQGSAATRRPACRLVTAPCRRCGIKARATGIAPISSPRRRTTPTGRGWPSSSDVLDVAGFQELEAAELDEGNVPPDELDLDLARVVGSSAGGEPARPRRRPACPRVDPRRRTEDGAPGPCRLGAPLILRKRVAAKPGCRSRTRTAAFHHPLRQDQEWRAVFVLNVVDGCIPSESATGTPDEIDEERRLLYRGDDPGTRQSRADVAMTARRSLN